MECRALRQVFSEQILAEAKRDRNIIVVCSDSRGSAALGPYPQILPDQFVEIGIAEQNAVSISAGMALIGKKVFAVGPASFYSLRAAEQVKTDLSYMGTNVKIIGISGGLSYGNLGGTHQSLQDIALMRSLPGMVVEIPSCPNQMQGLVRALIDYDGPAYVRVGRGAVPTIYEAGSVVKIGAARRHGNGTDAAVFACGETVMPALEAKEKLEKTGIYIRVYDMHTIKPLDTEAVCEAAETCGVLLSAEEHSIFGGLGGAVAEVLGDKGKALKRLGVPDRYLPHGSAAELMAYCGLNAEGIVAAVLERL